MAETGRGRRVRLVRKLERTIARGHPWIWREALEPHEAAPGEVLSVHDPRGRFLARGWADSGPIAVRVLSRDEREPIDSALLGRRIAAAFGLRRRVVPPRTNAYRLLHGEGDGIPGAVCDRYAHAAVLRLDGEAAAAWGDRIAAALRPELATLGVGALVVRAGRRGEEQVGLAWGELGDGAFEVEEHGMRLRVDPRRGQKTGLFLDHRESRARVRAVARDAQVLNLFGYTGGFSIAAGLGGAASVDTVDLAAPALALAERGFADNGLDPSLHRCHPADAFDFLAAAEPRWDVIVSDPPSFAPNEAALPAALASYKKLHAACLARLEEGGLYLAASCSSHVDRAAFDTTLLEGAGQARVRLTLLDSWGAPPDHPRALAFPEGDYLKVLLLRVAR